MTLLTLYYDISNLQGFRKDLAKIEQLRIIVPLEIANIELRDEKIKVTMSFPVEYKDLVLESFGKGDSE